MVRLRAICADTINARHQQVRENSAPAGKVPPPLIAAQQTTSVESANPAASGRGKRVASGRTPRHQTGGGKLRERPRNPNQAVASALAVELQDAQGAMDALHETMRVMKEENTRKSAILELSGQSNAVPLAYGLASIYGYPKRNWLSRRIWDDEDYEPTLPIVVVTARLPTRQLDARPVDHLAAKNVRENPHFYSVDFYGPERKSRCCCRSRPQRKEEGIVSATLFGELSRTYRTCSDLPPFDVLLERASGMRSLNIQDCMMGTEFHDVETESLIQCIPGEPIDYSCVVADTVMYWKAWHENVFQPRFRLF